MGAWSSSWSQWFPNKFISPGSFKTKSQVLHWYTLRRKAVSGLYDVTRPDKILFGALTVCYRKLCSSEAHNSGKCGINRAEHSESVASGDRHSGGARRVSGSSEELRPRIPAVPKVTCVPIDETITMLLLFIVIIVVVVAVKSARVCRTATHTPFAAAGIFVRDVSRKLIRQQCTHTLTHTAPGRYLFIYFFFYCILSSRTARVPT